MAEMTGGALIAKTLHAYGVDHVFFVDAILRRALIEMEALGIRRILTHSEKAAAYMADGYARAGQRPGVCMAQSVGAANLAAGLQDAWLGQSPVIAITGRQAAVNQYRNAYQELPHGPMFASVTRFSGRVDQVEQLPHLLRAAFREATASTPRPVHLDIAGHTGDLTGAATVHTDVVCDEVFGRIPAFRSPAPPADLEAVRASLRTAVRPVVVVGRAAMISQAAPALQAWAEREQVAVVGSLDGKAVLPESHPCFAGVAGTYSRACANEVLAQADWVLFAGSDTSDQTTASWTLPGHAARVVQVDPDPLELGRNFANALLVCADVRTFFEQWMAISAGSGALSTADRSAWIGFLGERVRAWREQARTWKADDQLPIRPAHLMGLLNSVMPDDALVVADTGYASQWAGTLLELNGTTQTFLRAAGSLGWAFPAALGARCAVPQRPVICVTGDGGFMYHLGELETACRWNIKTITIVNNNSQLAQGVPNIEAVYKGRDNSLQHEIHTFRPLNFADIAKDHGALGLRVEDPKHFKSAFEAALANDGPSVIDVVTDPMSRPISGAPPRAS